MPARISSGTADWVSFIEVCLGAIGLRLVPYLIQASPMAKKPQLNTPAPIRSAGGPRVAGSLTAFGTYQAIRAKAGCSFGPIKLHEPDGQ